MTATRPLRVYADRSHYREEHRRALADILKAHWNTAPLAERRAAHGNRLDLFEVVDAPERADLHLLTMKWPHYVSHGLVGQAITAVDAARRAGKPIAVFSETDHEANFPVSGRDVHVFEASGYRSRTRYVSHGMPVFIDDPLAQYCEGMLSFNDSRVRPAIGFCGQAGTTLRGHAERAVRAYVRIALWKLGRTPWEPAPFEHTWFRKRVLDRFATSSRVDARFVLRTHYRAGLSEVERADGRERSRREFIANMLDTDYTVCLRGGGNFSVRFYEALALGRIPIFIDTDCLLPYAEHIDWRGLVCWIDRADVGDPSATVADAHAAMTVDDLHARQRRCRQVWEQRLCPDGFYAHFHEHFPGLKRGA